MVGGQRRTASNVSAKQAGRGHKSLILLDCVLADSGGHRLADKVGGQLADRCPTFREDLSANRETYEYERSHRRRPRIGQGHSP